MAQRVIASQWQVLSPRRVVYPRPTVGGLDEHWTYRCEPHLEISDLVAEQPVATNATTDAKPISVTELIDRQPVALVHRSLCKEYLSSLVFALLGTSILWIGIIFAIVAIRGLLSW